jgi:hypothetical protein
MKGLFGTEGLTQICSELREMQALLQKVSGPNVVIFSVLIDDMATQVLCQREKIVSASEKCVPFNTECLFAIVSCSTCLSLKMYYHKLCKNILYEQGHINGCYTE